MPDFRLPNFIIFGSNKSGSTSLCNYLIQHPDIFISKKKEPNFFMHDEGSTVKHPSGATTVYTLDWYKYLFRNAQEKAIGEASVSYIIDEEAPMRIKSRLPDVKLIALLREPVSRLYSQYLFNVRGNLEKPNTDILKLIQSPKSSDINPRYFERGLYFKYLQNYYQVFEQKQIRIYLFDEFVSDPMKVVKDIFEFLDVDTTFTPTVGAKDAPSGIPKNQTIYNFIYKDNLIKKLLRPITRTLFPDRNKRRSLWTSLIYNSLERPELDPKVRQTISEMYRSDIIQLQKLINRDLSKWLS